MTLTRTFLNITDTIVGLKTHGYFPALPHVIISIILNLLFISYNSINLIYLPCLLHEHEPRRGELVLTISYEGSQLVVTGNLENYNFSSILTASGFGQIPVSNVKQGGMTRVLRASVESVPHLERRFSVGVPQLEVSVLLS
jgi:hypothetical protein